MIGSFKWQAGPAVAESLGMTTETLYPWLDAMGVQRIMIAHRKWLIDTEALLNALELWAKAERGETITSEDVDKIQAATESGKGALSTTAMSKAAERMANLMFGNYAKAIQRAAIKLKNLTEDEKIAAIEKLQAYRQSIEDAKQLKNDIEQGAYDKSNRSRYDSLEKISMKLSSELWAEKKAENKKKGDH